MRRNAFDVTAPPPRQPEPPVRPRADGRLGEDDVKRAVAERLRGRGYEVKVAWARTPGIDIDAVGPDGRVVVEAKGEAPAGAPQVNSFLGALGGLVQQMSDPDATYALALPDHRQYRDLVARLPVHARERFGLCVYFVRRDAEGNLTVDEG